MAASEDSLLLGMGMLIFLAYLWVTNSSVEVGDYSVH